MASTAIPPATTPIMTVTSVKGRREKDGSKAFVPSKTHRKLLIQKIKGAWKERSDTDSSPPFSSSMS